MEKKDKVKDVYEDLLKENELNKKHGESQLYNIKRKMCN